MTKPLRQTMPTVSAFIDEMRQVFGADDINASIRAGIDGQPTFYASENGRTGRDMKEEMPCCFRTRML